jgi:hypothetical protein
VSLILYHLCGGGSATNYRGLPDSVVQNNGYEKLVDDLINVRGPLMEELGIPKQVVFHTPGGQESDGRITLDQMFIVKPQISKSYMDQVKRLLDNNWRVYTYLGIPQQEDAKYYQDCILPFLRIGKNSYVALDAAATHYTPESYHAYIEYMSTLYPDRLIVEGEPLPRFANTPVILATGNQPYNWAHWLKQQTTTVYTILIPNKFWPETSVRQAKAMACLGYTPMLDFWLFDEDTYIQWST